MSLEFVFSVRHRLRLHGADDQDVLLDAAHEFVSLFVVFGRICDQLTKSLNGERGTREGVDDLENLQLHFVEVEWLDVRRDADVVDRTLLVEFIHHKF